jgi:hypothetical protein
MRAVGGPVRVEHEIDGTTVEYEDIPVEGDRIERLLTELFTEHWARITVGPVVQGAAWEIRFARRPSLSMSEGYLTADAGGWHFHLCVGDPSAGQRPDLARARRVARAAFFRQTGGPCTPASYGLRLWNGLGEQMLTVFFPNPFFDDEGRRLEAPDPDRTALWEDLKRRFGA